MRITNPVNITSLPPHSWKDFDFLIKIVTSIEMRTTMKEFHPPAQTRNFRHALERTIFRYPEMVFCGIRYTLSNAIFYPNTPRYGILAFLYCDAGLAIPRFLHDEGGLYLSRHFVLCNIIP